MSEEELEKTCWEEDADVYDVAVNRRKYLRKFAKMPGIIFNGCKFAHFSAGASPRPSGTSCGMNASTT